MSQQTKVLWPIRPPVVTTAATDADWEGIGEQQRQEAMECLTAVHETKEASRVQRRAAVRDAIIVVLAAVLGAWFWWYWGAG